MPATEADILELAVEDSECYLSEVDEQPKRLCSAIVKPEISTKIDSAHVKKIRRQQQNPRVSAFETRGFGHSRKRTHTPRVERHRGATYKPRDSLTESNLAVAQATTKTFETRGTQTERSGPCKCARAVKSKNQRRRLDSKKNKQLVDALVKHHSQRA